MARRIEQVNVLLKKEISKIINQTIEFDDNVLVTVVSAETTPDLRHVKVFLSVLPIEFKKQTLKKLNYFLSDIQSGIFRRLSMEPVPKIHFVVDETEEKAQTIENILDTIKE